MDELEATFKQELTQAEDWFADVRKKESGWIEEGKNPEQEFDRLYDDEPRVATDESEVLPWGPPYLRPDFLLPAVGVMIGLLLAKKAASSYIRRRKTCRSRTAAEGILHRRAESRGSRISGRPTGVRRYTKLSSRYFSFRTSGSIANAASGMSRMSTVRQRS